MGKIIVVDDQFDVRSLLFWIFRDDGHEVKMAADGTEALQLLRTFKPDLVLLDMNMPGMNGIETLEKIRSSGCQVDVIMMTDYGDIQNMEQAKDLGILYYMAKPFDLFELRERVKEILLNSSGISTQGITGWSLLPAIILTHTLSSYSQLAGELATFI